MSLLQALQILGVGEGRRQSPAPRLAPPTGETPRPQGRRRMPAHEAAQAARLPDPVPVGGYTVDGPVAELMEEAPALEQPSMAIRTQARPGILLSAYVPPSGPAADASGKRLG